MQLLANDRLQQQHKIFMSGWLNGMHLWPSVPNGDAAPAVLIICSPSLLVLIVQGLWLGRKLSQN